MDYVKKLLEENLNALLKQLDLLTEIVDYKTAFNKDVQAEIEKQTQEKKEIRDRQIAQAEEAFKAHYEMIKTKVIAEKQEHIAEYQKRADEAMPKYQETLIAIDEIKKTLNYMSRPIGENTIDGVPVLCEKQENTINETTEPTEKSM